MLLAETCEDRVDRMSTASDSQDFQSHDNFIYSPGTVIKEGTRIPPDSQTGVINSIAWRGDLMVLGDATGHLSFWDLKARFVIRVCKPLITIQML